MLILTLPTKALSLPEPALAYPEQYVQPPERPWKLRLLIFLLGGLVGLLILHILATYVQMNSFSPNSCPELIGSVDYTQAVHFHPQDQQMAAVQVANNLDGGAPAALVQVMTRDGENTRDIYVFGCSLQGQRPHLTQLFVQHGLAQGTAEITPDATLLTANMDTHLTPDKLPLLLPFQQNIYREYVWQRNHFVQRLFPGFYPVMSRFETDALQQSINQNKQQPVPWTDPLATAQQMSRDLLHWSGQIQARLLTATRTTARVELTHQQPYVMLEVTLQQFTQTGKGGLWSVTGAHTQGMLLTRSGTIDQPFLPSVTSPIQFSGLGALIDGRSTATLFDHTLMSPASATQVPLTVQFDGRYSGTVTYSQLASNQQGILLLQSLPKAANGQSEPGQILLTSLFLR